MMQNAYGDQCLGRTQCYDWFKRFKNGRESVDDDPCSGRPSTSTDDAHVTEFNAIVRSNRRLTVREIAEDCNISVGSCHEILVKKLGMHHVVAKFVPRLISQDQKDNRVTICQELLNRANDDDMYMRQIITGDRYGSMAMMLRQKSYHHSGLVNFLRDQKKLVRSDQTSKSC
ncbi:hypothetical protein AGLY_003348 [Aphis glycines]|uniref:Mos1 transposase HTH domain-containing protein n=1 Tax=Aphis glycines TaxID=307491 RepID=A0A6G0U0J2_APHGL|nr:hypothetical protein AGLY_003348 [Aphis glycines]